MNRRTTHALAACLALGAGVSSALSQIGTAFTYQGLLTEAGAPVVGTCDLRFTLFGAATGGSELFPAATSSNVGVTDGTFTTSVDFGVHPYMSTTALWMGIEVRSPAGAGAFVPLGTRQRLTPAPYSLSTRGINVNPTNLVEITGHLDITGRAVSELNSGQVQGSNYAALNFKDRGAFKWGIGKDNFDNFYFDRDGANRAMTISVASGNVGIGTTTPANKLDVGGRAYCDPSGFGSTQGVIGTRRADGLGATLLSGLAVGAGFPQGGHTIGVVNNAGSALSGQLFHNLATNQSALVANVKNFVEPNPRDPATDIYYACLEGPEAAMYTRGTARLENGRAVVSLPEHFSDLAASRGMTVMVMPRSADSRGLAVVASGGKGFEVRELLQGTGTYTFDWEVKAVRTQHLDYKVVRPWTDRRIADPAISQARAWERRLEEVGAANARAGALRSAAGPNP